MATMGCIWLAIIERFRVMFTQRRTLICFSRYLLFTVRYFYANIDWEQSLRMVTRARKSSEASKSRGKAGEKAGKEGLSSFPLGQFALSSPAELRLD